VKEKLAIFTTFANSLYPNEVNYLAKIQNFKDQDNINILNTIVYNVSHLDKPKNYSVGIDKRKYSKLKNWITGQLNKIDVDYFFEWLIEIDKKMNTDNILVADDEKIILKKLKSIVPTSYYFIRFYELWESYKDYLLIRMRFHMYESVSSYLETYRSNYENTLKINRELRKISEHIVHSKQINEIVDQNNVKQLELCM